MPQSKNSLSQAMRELYDVAARHAEDPTLHELLQIDQVNEMLLIQLSLTASEEGEVSEVVTRVFFPCRNERPIVAQEVAGQQHEITSRKHRELASEIIALCEPNTSAE